ncbi:MAG: hypothetical protein R3B70_42740 [Polyangiaceae bacterium]
MSGCDGGDGTTGDGGSAGSNTGGGGTGGDMGGTGGTTSMGGTGGSTMTTSTTTMTNVGTDNGAQAFDLVNAGGVAKSTNFKVVFTLGQSTQNQGRSKSSNYTMQGGLIGATGSLK